MALRGNFSQSFLRSKELLSYSEISYDKEGNYVHDKGILKEALARDTEGKLIRNKVNIAKILNKYGVLYRMVFNAMNMDQYTYDEVQEALNHLSDYINDLGVSGIIEFHAADKTQNSDHIHFWISTEDRLIYNKIAQEMVAMGYSNEEDVYIQKYEDNEKLDESEYVNSEDRSLSDRFVMKSMGMEAGETLDSIHEMLSIEDDLILEEVKEKETKDNQLIDGTLSSLRNKYNLVVDNISKLFKKVFDNQENIKDRDSVKLTGLKDSQGQKQPFWDRFRDEAQEGFDEYLDSFKGTPISKNCTLPKTNETDIILKRIEKLRESIERKK